MENPKAEDVIRKAVNVSCFSFSFFCISFSVPTIAIPLYVNLFLLQYDLVDIGEGGLSEDVTRNKVETVS